MNPTDSDEALVRTDLVDAAVTPDFFSRYYRPISLAILLVACFNVFFRLNRESVGEWDESLYATTAWEMMQRGDLVGTTFDGALDYYNSKPPLNVWILSAAFSTLGVNLTSLRIFSAVCALLTVWVLQRWTRIVFGSAVSVFSSVVLASLFGFLHQHSARSGNPDAMLTLMILLVVVVTWAASENPWQRVWLGPLLAAVFLLKGAAVLQPLLLVAIVEVCSRHRDAAHSEVSPNAVAGGLFVLLVGPWVAARWQLDGAQFFKQMIGNDLLGVTFDQLDNHRSGPLFYLAVLQRYHYDWLGAAAVGLVVAKDAWGPWYRTIVAAISERRRLVVLLIAWGISTAVVPTVMRTRVIWYLNPFYPLLALLAGLLFSHAFEVVGKRMTMRCVILGATIVLAFAVAESKSVWRLYRVTNLDTGIQGLLLAHTRRGEEQRVFRDRLVRSEAFIVRAFRNAEFQVMAQADRRPTDARRGDLVVTAAPDPIPGLRLLGRADGQYVYRAE